MLFQVFSHSQIFWTFFFSLTLVETPKWSSPLLQKHLIVNLQSFYAFLQEGSVTWSIRAQSHRLAASRFNYVTVNVKSPCREVLFLANAVTEN